MKSKLFLVFSLALLHSISGLGQVDEKNNTKERGNNVFTGGLFMEQGEWEFKLYNNLYTQTEPKANAKDKRSSFNTTFLQFTLGSDKNINYGLDLLYKSNVINDLAESSPFSALQFMSGARRNQLMNEDFNTEFSHGLTHLGPRIRVKPFRNKKFTFQQAVYAPTGELNEGWIINSDLFFEHIIDQKYMVFGNLGVWYPLAGDPFPYARVFAGTFLFNRLAPFVMLNLPYETGAGLKFFITPKIELEFMYSYWLPFEFNVGNNSARSINFGLRFTNFNNF